MALAGGLARAAKALSKLSLDFVKVCSERVAIHQYHLPTSSILVTIKKVTTELRTLGYY